MKNIFVMFSIVILAIVLQSFTYLDKNVSRKIPGDSVNVNINIKNQPTKLDPDVYKNLQELLQQNINLNTAKQKVYNKLLNINLQPKEEITTFDYYCIDRGYEKQKILEKAKSSTTIIFITSILILIITYLLLNFFILKSIAKGVDWKYTLILAILVIIIVFIISVRLEYILEYIFNKDFLIFKELNQFK